MSAIDLTRDLKQLVRLAAQGDGLDELLRQGLDGVLRIAPSDMAAVLTLDAVGERLDVRAARGALASPAVRRHGLELKRFPSIREVLATRRAHVNFEDDHRHGDGDPYDGVLDLPAGHGCMVVPLVTADRPIGVLTLDRTRCEPFAQPVVDLVEIYAQVFALALENAEQKGLLLRQVEAARERDRLATEAEGDGHGVLSQSRAPSVRALADRARRVADTDTAVLILGETGTGKERLARAVHDWSQRASGPFVAINCAAIPSGLLESELFGHVRGAFTGAARDRAGRFVLANGGTLLLDEVGELPLDLQAKLLRVLQEGEVTPVGSDRALKVDVRVLAATHVDLDAAASAGRFRSDLLYRLNVFPLPLPPLRDRLEDLPLLCAALLDALGARKGRKYHVTADGLAHLSRHTWPGNIRELGNVLERATILTSAEALTPEVLDLPRGAKAPPSAGPPPALRRDATGADAAAPDLRTLEDVERDHIRSVLRHTDGRLYGAKGAAKLLGMKPTTLQSRMKKLGVERVEELRRD